METRTKTSNEPDTISLGIEQPGCLPQFLSRQRTWWPSRHFEQITTTSRWSVSISNMTQHFHVCPESYTPEFVTPNSLYGFTMYKNKKDASQSCFTVMWEVVWDRVSHSPGTLTNPTKTMTITSPQCGGLCKDCVKLKWAFTLRCLPLYNRHTGMSTICWG